MGLRGVEPRTSRLSGVRSNHLSYRPQEPQKLCRHAPPRNGSCHQHRFSSDVGHTHRPPEDLTRSHHARRPARAVAPLRAPPVEHAAHPCRPVAVSPCRRVAVSPCHRVAQNGGAAALFHTRELVELVHLLTDIGVHLQRHRDQLAAGQGVKHLAKVGVADGDFLDTANEALPGVSPGAERTSVAPVTVNGGDGDAGDTMILTSARSAYGSHGEFHPRHHAPHGRRSCRSLRQQLTGDGSIRTVRSRPRRA